MQVLDRTARGELPLLRLVDGAPEAQSVQIQPAADLREVLQLPGRIVERGQPRIEFIQG